MAGNQRHTTRAWGWAVAANVVIFAILWILLSNIDAPEIRSADTDNGSGSGSSSTGITDPGAAFGQLDQSVGDRSTSNGEPSVENATEDETYIMETGHDWTDEFYLDSGPPLSFAPRLNEDGTPRPHINEEGLYKSPTYEDEAATYNAEDLIPPIMTPDVFSRLDLPEEFREMNLSLTVKVRLDARGNVRGTPEIIRSSGQPVVDQITVNKILNEVNFTPAERQDTGQPVPVYTQLWIRWVD